MVVVILQLCKPLECNCKTLWLFFSYAYILVAVNIYKFYWVREWNKVWVTTTKINNNNNNGDNNKR